MTITREDLDAGRVDLGDLVEPGAEPLPPVRPGDILGDWLQESGASAYGLAKAMGVPVNRVTAILEGRRAVTADTAIRLGKAMGTSPDFWLGLQSAHDLEVAKRAGAGDGARPLAA